MRGDRAVVAPIRSRLAGETRKPPSGAHRGLRLAEEVEQGEEAGRAGKLSVVLEAFEQEPLPVHMVYAQRKLVPLKLRAFLNWTTPRLKARLPQQDD